MRVYVKASYRTLSALSSRKAPQITWTGVGTFDTVFLKNAFKTFKQTGIDAVDLHLEGATAVLTYPRGHLRLESQRVRGPVHAWHAVGHGEVPVLPDREAPGDPTPSPPRPRRERLETHDDRRAVFRCIQGGAA